MQKTSELAHVLRSGRRTTTYSYYYPLYGHDTRMRASLQIGQKGAQSIYYAIDIQAERIGVPLTHWVTINFSQTAVDPAEATRAFQKLRLNHFNKWCARRAKCPPTWAFVFENRRDDDVFQEVGPGLDHNIHAHWAVHIPEGRYYEFQELLWDWVERVTGGILEAAAIHHEPITNAKTLKEYLLKGTRTEWAETYAAEPQPQGAILGQRTGTSRNLGGTARRALDKELNVRRRIPSRPRRAAA